MKGEIYTFFFFKSSSPELWTSCQASPCQNWQTKKLGISLETEHKWLCVLLWTPSFIRNYAQIVRLIDCRMFTLPTGRPVLDWIQRTEGFHSINTLAIYSKLFWLTDSRRSHLFCFFRTIEFKGKIETTKKKPLPSQQRNLIGNLESFSGKERSVRNDWNSIFKGKWNQMFCARQVALDAVMQKKMQLTPNCTRLAAGNGLDENTFTMDGFHNNRWNQTRLLIRWNWIDITIQVDWGSSSLKGKTWWPTLFNIGRRLQHATAHRYNQTST